MDLAFIERVEKVLLDDTLADKQEALLPLIKEHLSAYPGEIEKAMSTWADMMAALVHYHNLGRN